MPRSACRRRRLTGPLASRSSRVAATKTKTGLTIYARLDDRDYPKGIEVSDSQLAAVNLHPRAFHGDWNYTITPSQTET
jgi:hypothetical protein